MARLGCRIRRCTWTRSGWNILDLCPGRSKLETRTALFGTSRLQKFFKYSWQAPGTYCFLLCRAWLATEALDALCMRRQGLGRSPDERRLAEQNVSGKIQACRNLKQDTAGGAVCMRTSCQKHPRRHAWARSASRLPSASGRPMVGRDHVGARLTKGEFFLDASLVLAAWRHQLANMDSRQGSMILCMVATLICVQSPCCATSIVMFRNGILLTMYQFFGC